MTPTPSFIGHTKPHTRPVTPSVCASSRSLAPLGSESAPYSRTQNSGRHGLGCVVTHAWQPHARPVKFEIAARFNSRDERFSLASTEGHNGFCDRVLFYPLTLSTGRRGALQSHRRDLESAGLFCPRSSAKLARDCSKSLHETPSSQFSTWDQGSFLCATSCSEFDTRRSE